MRRLVHMLGYAAPLSVVCGLSVWGHDSNTPYAQWISSLRKPDFPLSTCCGIADQYYVKEYQPSRRDGIAFTAIVTTHDGRTDFSIDVPEEKVIWNRFNPTGRAVIFIEDNDWVSKVVCFVPSIGT